jgi:ATP-dependent Zn protease
VEKLAKMTVGFSGADLENMVNTAAIRAAVEGHLKTFHSTFIKKDIF